MGRLLTVTILSTVALLTAGAVLLGSGSPAAACGGSTANPATAASHPPVAGYGGDQLANAAAIMNAGAALGISTDGQAIGVMTAMGESGLRNLTYGDTAGPDSRGLFQQRANWGTLAQRLNPTTAATLFFHKLVTIPGWQAMTPTLAAHAVQANADPGYYTPFWPPALKVITALTIGQAACTANVSADGRALAQNLVTAIDAGRITGLIPDHLREIRWIAEGRTVPNCGVDDRILQVITIALTTFGRIGISDINRHCTGQLDGAGTQSSHWVHGGGQAVDFYSLGGIATDGADANALRLIRTLDPVMPSGARVGQAECRTTAGDVPTLVHLVPFDDTCTHLHIDVAYATGGLTAANLTTAYARQ